jgi:hypothetical protein
VREDQPKDSYEDDAKAPNKMTPTSRGSPFVQANLGVHGGMLSPASVLCNEEQGNLTSANKLCRAEQADPTFAATHGGKTFVEFYGTGKGKNAFGNCVSLKAQNSTKVEQSELNPARTCSAIKTAMGTLFGPSFGTNATHRNAFGKCVSYVARFQSTAVMNAVSACMTELNDATFAATHDGKTFAEFYGTNADLSNAFGNCVAAKLGVARNELRSSLMRASKTCRSMRTNDPAGFRTKYGTRPNAFAKCVVAHTHAR